MTNGNGGRSQLQFLRERLDELGCAQKSIETQLSRCAGGRNQNALYATERELAGKIAECKRAMATLKVEMEHDAERKAARRAEHEL